MVAGGPAAPAHHGWRIATPTRGWRAVRAG